MIAFGGTEQPRVARLVLIENLQPVDRDSKKRAWFMDPATAIRMATALAVASLAYASDAVTLEHPVSQAWPLCRVERQDAAHSVSLLKAG